MKLVCDGCGNKVVLRFAASNLLAADVMQGSCCGNLYEIHTLRLSHHLVTGNRGPACGCRDCKASPPAGTVTGPVMA